MKKDKRRCFVVNVARSIVSAATLARVWRIHRLGAVASMIVWPALTPTPMLGQETSAPIPVPIELSAPGFVTLVIEDDQGKRVRNLISHERFEAGSHTVWWDGLDDLQRDPESAKHGVFRVPGRIVPAGRYTVRGLVHPGIDLIYQMTPYTHGDPPWRTADLGSQWLTNHSAPSDVVFLPAGVAPVRDGKPTSQGGQLLVCSRVAEGGSGLAWLDTNGKKLWGQHWLGGVWTAASHLAVDRGQRPVEGVYAYAGASWHGGKYNDYKAELRLHKLVNKSYRVQAPSDTRFGTGEDRPVLQPTYELPFPPGTPKFDLNDKNLRSQHAASLTGLAAHNGILACAVEKLDRIVFVDVRKAQALGEAAVAAPRGLAFTEDGRLLAISRNRLLRFAIDLQAPARLSAPEIVVNDLEAPQYVVADDHNIYVSDWGSSHQVKIFSGKGQPRGVIGDPGAPELGTYNANHMNHPAGMALDDRDRLWVTENTHIPKRVSVWNLTDHSLVDAFYGPMRYGGAGAVDPHDKTRFFYDDDHGGAIEFRLDYDTGRSIPISIPYLESYNTTGLIGRYTGAAPSYPLHHGRFLYLTDAYNLHTTGRRSAALWRLDDGLARIVAAAGNILDSTREVLPAFQDPAIKSRMPDGFTPRKDRSLLFVWTDGNGNQRLDPDEVQFLDPTPYANPENSRPETGTVTVTDDLAFTFSSVGNAVIRLKPAAVSDMGIPSYDLQAREILATGTQRPASSGGNQVLPARDGWLITTTPVEPFSRYGVGAVRDGEPIWTYPSLWPGLHASHAAPMPTTDGQLIGTTRVLGPVIDAPPGSDAGQFWAINGNKGNIYVFTVDGLFVARLFQDCRTTSWNAPKAERGMKVNHLSLQEECFGPTWTRTEQGEVYLQAHFVGNIIKVNNLGKVRRLPDHVIDVSRQQLASAQKWTMDAEAQRQAAMDEATGTLRAAVRDESIKIDGLDSEWRDADFVTIDKRKQKVGNWGKRDNITDASAMIAGEQLCVIWRTHDRDLLQNSGESLNNLFKCGGALDLMIGTSNDADPARREPVPGDQRLLITQVDGKTVAVLYEPVSARPGTEPVEFGSPLRTLLFDRVEDVSHQVQLASGSETDRDVDKDGNVIRTTYEVAVPLDLLGFDPKADEDYRFDIGILRGDGFQTLQRACWRNKATGVVSDIPSEAELLPGLWGTIRFRR